MKISTFPSSSPYYIYAPSWTYKSSGVRVLHSLCHILNAKGYKAYICPDNGSGYCVNPYLDTPILKPEVENFFNLNDITPIVVYPDIVRGNPFNAKKVVRYLLAPAGKYGGETNFKGEKVYGYRSDIAKPTLCLPTFDTDIFYPSSVGYMNSDDFLKNNWTKQKKNDGSAIRSGSCFYSHKYEMHGGKPENHGTRLQGSPYQIAEILRNSEICYVYEMSEIIVLAKLCGCPVKIVQTDYFNKLPEPWDFDGTVQEWWSRFERQLKEFIHDTQTAF